MKDTLWELLVGVFIVAVVFMVARPGAPAAQAVSNISGALEELVKQATHYSITTP